MSSQKKPPGGKAPPRKQPLDKKLASSSSKKGKSLEKKQPKSSDNAGNSKTVAQQLTHYLGISGEDAQYLKDFKRESIAQLNSQPGVKFNSWSESFASCAKDPDTYLKAIDAEIEKLTPPESFQDRVARGNLAALAAMLFQHYKLCPVLLNSLRVKEGRLTDVLNEWQKTKVPILFPGDSGHPTLSTSQQAQASTSSVSGPPLKRKRSSSVNEIVEEKILDNPPVDVDNALVNVDTVLVNMDTAVPDVDNALVNADIALADVDDPPVDALSDLSDVSSSGTASEDEDVTNLQPLSKAEIKGFLDRPTRLYGICFKYIAPPGRDDAEELSGEIWSLHSCRSDVYDEEYFLGFGDPRGGDPATCDINELRFYLEHSQRVID